MTNHPNRGWRRRMNDAALSFVMRQEWPDGDICMMTREQVMRLVSDCYVAGYQDGRASVAPKKGTP